MAAQLSASVPGDSLLYSFTPVNANRASGGAPAPPPPLSPRRMRAQSVTGDASRRPDSNDHTTELQVGPRSPGFLHSPGRPSHSGGQGGGGQASGSTGPGGGGSGPPSIFGRSGSADRHSYAGGGGMPHLVSASGGSASANGMRHMGGSSSPVGLPRLDIPAGGFGLTGQDAPLSARGLPPGAGRRGSVSGGGGGGGALCESSMSLSASLDNPFAGIDVNAALSPRHGAPAILAPLRPQLPSVNGGGGGGPSVTAATAAAAAAAALAEESSGNGANHGWCGAAAGAGGAFPHRRGRRNSASYLSESPSAPLPSGALSAFGDSALASMLAPAAVGGGSPSQPAPRRSHSLTARSGSGGLCDDGGGGGGGSCSGADAAAAAATAADILTRCSGSYGSLGSAGSSADYAAAAHSLTSAAELLTTINDDLQRAAGALLALHAPACRPRSAAPNAPPPPPPPVTAAQLAALRASAPELHAELRVAVRRAFQVMRQAATGGGGGGGVLGGGGGVLSAVASGPSALGGRQLGSCVHECWATLDAFLEGTAELTMSLVEGALDSKSPGAASPPLGRSKSRGGAAIQGEDGEEDAHGGSASAGAGHRRRSSDGAGAGGDTGSARSSDGSRRGSGLFKLHDAVHELEHLRAANEDLQQQLDDSRARLAAAEARAAEGDGATGAEAEASGVARVAGAVGAGPRPPASHAAPPSDTCSGSSPRRGKHARMQGPQRKEGAGDGSSGDGSDRHARSEPGDSNGAGGGNGADSSPRLFDRVLGLARGVPASSSRKELIIEEEDSGSGREEEEGEEDAGVAGSRVPRGKQALRVMLTTHSASFAEWMRNGRRR